MAGQRICDDVSYEGGAVTHALKGETRAVERNGSQLRSVEERDRRLRQVERKHTRQSTH
jgi:DNA repair ATPase RecN